MLVRDAFARASAVQADEIALLLVDIGRAVATLELKLAVALQATHGARGDASAIFAGDIADPVGLPSAFLTHADRAVVALRFFFGAFDAFASEASCGAFGACR